MSVRLENMESFERARMKLRRTAVFHANSAAASTETIAKELAPVLTGFMRDNVRQTKIATPEDVQAITESTADYSAHVEFGTVNQDAQPFFTPAFESAKKQLGKVRGIF